MSSDNIWKLEQRFPGFAVACLPGVSITMLKVSWFMTAFHSLRIKHSQTCTLEHGAESVFLGQHLKTWLQNKFFFLHRSFLQTATVGAMCVCASKLLCVFPCSVQAYWPFLQQRMESTSRTPGSGFLLLPFPCWEQAESCSKLHIFV